MTLHLSALDVSKLLAGLARVCALLGGVFMVAIMLITCASVIGRELMDHALVGDFELVGVVCGLAIAMFMPWCQLRRGNILVDFFTAGAPPKLNVWLDRVGALFVALVMVLLAWRSAVGGINAWENHASSMMLGVPHWWVYAGMVPPFALCAAIALAQAIWASEQNESETLQSPSAA